MKRALIAELCLIASFLSGCGLGVPDLKEPLDHAGGTAEIEFEIKKRVFCDLKFAVTALNQSVPVKSSLDGREKPLRFIPLDWGAHLSLSLGVDESSALNPGVILNTPRANATSFFPGLAAITTPQSFNLGLGATLSSTATRIDKFDSYYSVDYLMAPKSSKSVCDHDPLVDADLHPATSSPLIISDLRIYEWLEGAMFVNDAIPSVAAFPAKPAHAKAAKVQTVSGLSGLQPDTITLEVKFVIVSNGSITPTWKLVRVSANTGTPLLATGRTRTHDLIITIGPNTPLTTNTLLASQIGQAVSSGNQALIGP